MVKQLQRKAQPRVQPKVQQTPSAVGRSKTHPLTVGGQHHGRSRLCLATTRKGGLCCEPVVEPGLPYCATHSRTGDPSLKVKSHPRFGKVLTAARDLPCGYKIAWWGVLKKEKEMTTEAKTWAFDIGSSYIDATPFQRGSLVQFCGCPGPDEIATLKMNTIVVGKKVTGNTKAKNDAKAFVMFTVVPNVLRTGYQVTLQYGNNSKQSNEFFTERGLTRENIGTPRLPTLKRKGI